MDSPKCPICLEEGIIAQTYKVVRSQTFKCQRCGKLTEKAGLDEREFKWKDDYDSWHSMIVDRIKDKQASIKDNVKKELDKLEKIKGKK